MADSVFFDLEFFLLVGSSLVLPMGIYFYLYRRRAISRKSVLGYAAILIALSVIDVLLLQSLAASAKSTLSTIDDQIFSSGLSVALYILPAIFAGIAINLVSHILNIHLDEAEKKFEQQPVPKPLNINFKILRFERKRLP
ncbi:MAG: hypothetical protein NTX56_07810 [Proteobacteria bacterium]|nr:hypothetical protein [Pseudomonadota bacterium]